MSFMDSKCIFQKQATTSTSTTTCSLIENETDLSYDENAFINSMMTAFNDFPKEDEESSFDEQINSPKITFKQNLSLSSISEFSL